MSVLRATPEFVATPSLNEIRNAENNKPVRTVQTASQIARKQEEIRKNAIIAERQQREAEKIRIKEEMKTERLRRQNELKQEQERILALRAEEKAEMQRLKEMREAEKLANQEAKRLGVTPEIVVQTSLAEHLAVSNFN